MAEAAAIKLNRAQSSYLEDLQAKIEWPEGLKLNGLVLEGSRRDVEVLRDRLTDVLAERGFGADYVATPEGDLVEDLIDALFIP